MPPFTGHPSFTDPELTEVSWSREQSVDDCIGLQHTYSYVIRATDRRRATGWTAEVRAIAAAAPARPARTVRIPVICQVWRSTCR